MSLLWGIARKLLGLQCPSFTQRYPYILSWECLWSFGRPHSTAKISKEVPPFSNKMLKICNSGYAQKKTLLGLDFFGDNKTLDRVWCQKRLLQAFTQDWSFDINKWSIQYATVCSELQGGINWKELPYWETCLDNLQTCLLAGILQSKSAWQVV